MDREPREHLSPAEEFCLDLLCCSARLLGNESMKENQGSQTSGSAEIVAETMKHENVPRTAKNVRDRSLIIHRGGLEQN